MAHTNGVGGSPLLQTLLSQTDSVGAAGKKEKAAQVATGTTVAQDRAQLSTTASALLRTAGTDESARSEKVQALQGAIASGTYSVAASDVADAVIRNLLK